MWAWRMLNLMSSVIPSGVVPKFGEGVTPQASSSDRGSKLRGSAKSNPRVASKRSVNPPVVVRMQEILILYIVLHTYIVLFKFNTLTTGRRLIDVLFSAHTDRPSIIRRLLPSAYQPVVD
ncbi:hypothetical protein AVEN_6600-1 [Araneus ventricosus]|uniref:Uncharacterized protein n=1 Tax=Araneus ventricosus TaxID=182803 RepID=A0A4Y2RMP2_ARAVE|nr:hypothetical protein AVEN_267666-1 [Araneus ventricosus]GBN76529.1 hypothetical protein AVEN_6600-1 [Araneus ventricosus]